MRGPDRACVAQLPEDELGQGPDKPVTVCKHIKRPSARWVAALLYAVLVAATGGDGWAAVSGADAERAGRIRLYVQMGEEYAVRHYDDEAIRAFRIAADMMRENGADVDDQLAIIERLAQLNDTAGAIEALQSLLRVYPDQAEARARLAKLLPGSSSVRKPAVDKTPTGAEQRARLDLFIKMGNDYSAHNLPAEAIQAFRAAARLSLEQDLPMPDQLALIEHLAALQDVPGAMEALRNVVAKYPDDAGARTLHAKYLASIGQSAAAIREVDVVLSANPSNKDAILVKANAADWQGDQATALPLYEKLLDEQEDFDVRLAYTGALLRTGNNEKAQKNLEQLIPSSDVQKRALNDLEWYLRNKTAQNFQLRQEVYSDTGHTDVSKSIVSFEVPLRASLLGFKLGQANTSDQFQRITSREYGIDGNSRYSDTTSISGGVGAVELNTGQGGSVTTSYVEARTRLPRLDTLVSLNRAPETGSTSVLTNETITSKVRGVVVYSQLQRWTVDADLTVARDSADDRYTRLITAARYLLYSGAPQVQVGLRRDMNDSRRHAWWGDIYSADQVNHDLLLSLSMRKNRLDGGIELSYGKQKYTAFGTDYYADNAGWNATLQYQWANGLFVDAQWQGAIYGLDQNTPFSYRQLNLRAISYF